MTDTCKHNGDWRLEECALGGLLWRHVLCVQCGCALFELVMEPDPDQSLPSKASYTDMVPQTVNERPRRARQCRSKHR